MSIQHSSPQKTLSPRSVQHPLDPLTADEIEGAVAVLRAEQDLGERVRFEVVTLQEPPKHVVSGFRRGDAIQREAFVVLLDGRTGKTYEAIVSLTEGVVVSWKHIPGVQPRLMPDEMLEAQAMVKENDEYRKALRDRGITDLDLVMIDTWGAGNFGVEEEKDLRLALGRSFLRSSPTDNGYARPIEGVTAVIDLNKMEVIRVEDRARGSVASQPGQLCRRFRQGIQKRP